MWRAAFGAMVAVSAIAATGEYEGSQPYTPTKAGWFAVEMNCLFKNYDGNDGVSVHFVPMGEKMRVSVVYVRDEHKPAADFAADAVLSRAKQAARNRGWDNWIDFDLRVEKAKP